MKNKNPLFKRLGDYIQLVDNRNKDLAVTNLLGINIKKEFMPSVANVSGTDLSKYKIIKKGQFATNIMHVGRDERLPISLYSKEDKAIVSPAYKTFEIVDETKLLSEFLMIEFQRPEFDRKAWTYCDSSVRGGLDWDRLCEMEIPIPDIEIQKKYVNIYKALQKNQKTYENSLDDLQLICDTYIEDLIKKEELKLLGQYIEQSEERNSNLEYSIDDVKGVSNSKQFMPTKANNNGRNLEKFYVISPNDFVYNSRTTRMGDKVGLGYNNSEETFLTSWNNTAFRIKQDALNKIIPAYLYIFFNRSEFDRYARFNSWGSSTEIFTWDDMCNVKLPVPNIEIQKAIVTIYHTLENRKKINNQLKELVKPLCPVLMRGVVEEG